MLGKGIILLLIWLLFISRLIPKYLVFRETNQVHLLGVAWEGNIALLVIFTVAVLAMVILALGIKYIYQYFSTARKSEED